MESDEGLRCAIYVRISKDKEDNREAVIRQEGQCRAHAERRGWSVVEPSRRTDKKDKAGKFVEDEAPKVYVDNSISASRYERRIRPSFRLMMEDARAKRFDVIVCTALDRLTRQPRELEDIIDMIQETGIKVVTLQGDIDLQTSQGRVMAGVLAAFSRGEVEAKSQRQKDANGSRRESGEFYKGAVPVGYVRGDVKVVTHEDESFTVHRMTDNVEGDYEVITKAIVPDPKVEEHLRAAFRSVVNGDSLREIANSWDKAGFKPPRAKQWSLTSVNKLLLSPTFAAIQTFEGKEIGQGRWVPYLSREEHEEVLRALASRRKSHGVRQSRQEYLLTGILRCSCNRYMTGTSGYKGMKYYRCSGRNGGFCSRSVALDIAHKKILNYVIGAFVTMDPSELVPQETRERQRELASQLVQIDASRKRYMADLSLEEDSLQGLLSRLDTKYRVAIEEVRQLDSENALTDLLNHVLPWIVKGVPLMEGMGRSKESVRARFEELGTVQQRTVVDALGFYKLSTGMRGRWTTVVVYPRHPITREISDISIDMDPWGAEE